VASIGDRAAVVPPLRHVHYLVEVLDVYLSRRPAAPPPALVFAGEDAYALVSGLAERLEVGDGPGEEGRGPRLDWLVDAMAAGPGNRLTGLLRALLAPLVPGLLRAGYGWRLEHGRPRTATPRSATTRPPRRPARSRWRTGRSTTTAPATSSARSARRSSRAPAGTSPCATPPATW
jgi:hypothetical protein